MMDKIVLDALPVLAHIGTLPGEIDRGQPLRIRAELSGDFRQAGRSDDLNDTFDYSRIESRLAELAGSCRFRLLEALAEHLCSVILAEEPKVLAIRLRIDKPGAARLAGCVSLEIERSRSA